MDKEERKDEERESYAKIKAERDAMQWFVNSLDGRIVVNPIKNGKYERRMHNEILYYIKAMIHDLEYNLASIRDGDIPR